MTLPNGYTKSSAAAKATLFLVRGDSRGFQVSAMVFLAARKAVRRMGFLRPVLLVLLVAPAAAASQFFAYGGAH